LDQEDLLKIPRRIVLTEKDERDLQPITEYPSPDFRLPSDLHLSQPLDQQRSRDSSVAESASPLSSYAVETSQFGKQAQVVSFIDRILRVMHLATDNEHNTLLKLAKLADLDNELREFFAVIMEDGARSSKSQTALSTAVGLSIR
jgi:hypothetical protein